MNNFKCKYCKNETYRIKALSGSSSPNAVGVYCEKCGKWHKWLNREEKKELGYSVSSTVVNPCIYCGAEIPEGRHICCDCETKLNAIEPDYLSATQVKEILISVYKSAKKKNININVVKEILTEVAVEYGLKGNPTT